MRILSRYFASRYLALFATILLTSIVVIVTVEMLLNLDQMFDLEQSWSGVATYLLLRIPSYYLSDLLPVASFGAAFFSLALASRWNEIVAMKAGGISPLRAALPVLGTALVLSIAALLVHESFVLEATRRWESLDDGGSRSLDYRRGSFWYQRGRTIYNIRGADRDSRTLEGISLFERDRVGRLVRSIHASRARIEDDGRWHFEQAVIRRFDPSSVDAPPSLETRESAVLNIEGDGEAALMDADASLLPLAGLAAHVRARDREGRPVQRLVALLHARLADPMAVWLMALIGVPLGLRAERTRTFGQSMLIGVVTLALFFLVRNVARTLGAEGVVPPAAAPWTVVVLFGGLGLWQASRAPR